MSVLLLACVVVLLLFLPVKAGAALDCGSVALRLDVSTRLAREGSSDAARFKAERDADRQRTCNSKYQTRIIVASAVGVIGAVLVLGVGWAYGARPPKSGGPAPAE